MPKISDQTRPIYLGVDPGASGGLATVGGETLGTPMPKTEWDVWTYFHSLRGRVTFGMIEQVGGYIQDNASPGSAMFKFGRGYGGLRMALIAAGIWWTEVTPQRWQKEFVVHRKKSESKTQFKNRLKAKAQQLFPGVNVTLATADAILIAEYCRRTHR